MADTYLQWGGYRHPDWEMNLASYTKRARLSPRGRIISYIYTMRLEGEILADGVTPITTRMNQIAAAYIVQNQDAKFYVDGVLTPNQLLNGGSVTGNKVIEMSNPRGDAAEYANKRCMAVVLQGEYEDAESQLIDYEETIQMVGDCGPRDEWFGGFIRPVRQEICKATTMHIVQSGRAVGWAGYVLAPGPVWPLIEHRERRSVEYGTPQFLGQAHRLYPSRWTYIHETNAYTETFPLPR